VPKLSTRLMERTFSSQRPRISLANPTWKIREEERSEADQQERYAIDDPAELYARYQP
jgi:hypothetical protein